MNLKNFGIGALARALASTAVIGVVSFAGASAYAQTADEVATVKAAVEAIITRTVQANPNMTPDQLSAAIKVAVNAYLNDPANNFSTALKVQALAAVKADTAFQSAFSGSSATALEGVQLALFGTTATTADIGGSGGQGPSGFSGTPGAGTGGGGGGSGAHNL